MGRKSRNPIIRVDGSTRIDYTDDKRRREAGCKKLYLFRRGRRKVSLNIIDVDKRSRLNALKRAINIIDQTSIENEVEGRAPSEVSILQVMQHFRQYRLESADSKVGCNSAIAALKQFYESTYSRDLRNVMVSEFTGDVQRELCRYLSTRSGPKGNPLKFGSIMVYARYYRAALNYASRADQIEQSDGSIKQCQLITHFDGFWITKNNITRWTGLEPPQQGIRKIPTPSDFARFFDSLDLSYDIDQGLFRFMILALNTGARARHILECDFRNQSEGRQVFRFENDGPLFLNLRGPNVKSRAAKSKRRPTIRVTKNLEGWLNEWQTDYPVQPFLSTNVSDIRQCIKRRCRRIGVPALRPHLIRDFVATHLVKNSKDGGLGLSIWLGHLERSKASVISLDHYLGQDSDYLKNEANVIDELILEIDEMANTTLVVSDMQ